MGREIELGREQVGGEKTFFEQLGARARKNLLQYCSGDYALMRGFYFNRNG
jgi:hypothetical protein